MGNLTDRINPLYKGEMGLLIFVLANVLFGVFLASVNKVYFEDIFVREDAYIEWMTVSSLVSTACLCLYRSVALFRLRGFVFALMLVFMAALFIFGAGEEISWGQRIFDIKSSAFFAEHNSQGETNIHNLVLGGTKINKLIFGTILGIIVVVYFAVIPVLYRKMDSVRRLVNKLALPIPTIVHIVAYILVAVMVSLTPSGKKGELLEFGGCALFFIMTLFPYNIKTFKPYE